MNKNNNLTQFINQYQLSKTLRFELIPQGETLANIEKNGLLEQDSNRNDAYKKAKKIIDEYHKFFIAEVLDNTSMEGLDSFEILYNIPKRDEVQKKEFETIQIKLRKQLSDAFTRNEVYKNLFGKELIKENLKVFVKNDDDKKIISDFENFTTYFTGFHENRKNMYVADEKSTAIAYRLINQNLPKFIDNTKIFDKIASTTLKENFTKITKDFELIIQVENLEDMFCLDYFNDTLSQRGIDIYNQIIGGFTSADEKIKVKGLNEYINLYNQQQKDKTSKLPKLKPLFKQILSDRNTLSWVDEQFDNDSAVLDTIEKSYQEIKEYAILPTQQGIISISELFRNIQDYDLNKIFIKNDLGLTDIAQKMFGTYSVFTQAINIEFYNQYTGKAAIGSEKYEEASSKYFKSFDSFSIQYLNNVLLLLPNASMHKKVQEYFMQLGANNEKNIANYIDRINEQYLQIEEILKSYDVSKNLMQDDASIEKIKMFLDTIKELQLFIKPLLGKGNESDKDEKFYSELDKLWNTIDQITPLYNKVRNYITRKPYSTEKYKLNFENSQLLDGWDVNKETANTSVLFMRNDCYYLGIMNKKHNKLFENLKQNTEADTYQKINYKLLPGASKMLPKVFFSSKNIAYYNPSDEILRIRNTGTHTKNGQPQKGFDKSDFNLKDCHKIIDFFKESINRHPDWKNFKYNFASTNTFNSIDEFYREVENDGYGISFTNIDTSYINTLVSDGKLYLFQIYNKDFSPNSKGTPNMHTLYWKMLFDQQNLNDVVYKLNGQAEVFFRKSSIKKENIITHKANIAIDNKNNLNEKKQSTFAYDIIKDKRFTVDKFQFHVPITLNFKAKGNNNLNTLVNETIQQNGIQHIIGIDRGERHLLYLSLIDLEGNIIQQFSLNEIINEYAGNTYKTNYHTLLDSKEGSREEARKNWKTIENIKELKQGYLSQVIHKITQLIIQYNAIVVMEDLNFGFKQGRQKVEKSVYQQFEKMLIDKLNFYVDKQKQTSELGGTLKALQLTNKFESFAKMGKQNGFLFYIPAWNTSKIDPVTGFTNMFYTKWENISNAKAFFNKFKSIKYNTDKNYFEFEVDNYNSFNPKAEGTRQNWTICTNAQRIITFRNKDKNNQWDNKEVTLTYEFESLLKKYNISYKEDNLQTQIDAQTDRLFFESLLNLFKLTLQMRNSITNSDVDYLISPVADANGIFYDSRNFANVECPPLPKDADANGAYNIARKGMWVVEQITNANDLKKLKLAISNKEWLQFVQNIK
jgi:CRISPR-associated protein Cpf1